MQKRFLMRVVSMTLVLMMAFSMTTALADWYCGDCGSSNSGNFCTDCGSKKPAEDACPSCSYSLGGQSYNFCPNCGEKLSSSVSSSSSAQKDAMTITSVSLNSDGTVHVSWTDTSNNGPYDVCYMQMVSNDISADFDLNHPNWLGVEDTYGTSATLNRLVPGQQYWIILYDADDNYVYKAYKPSSPTHFYEFGTNVSMNLKTRKGTQYNELSSFSSSAIASNIDTLEYGAYIKLTYPQLARARNYNCLISITAPNGSVITDEVTEMDLPSGRTNTYWSFYSFNWFFNIMTKYYGEVPVGTYTWTMYYDGMFVNSQTFRVTN